MKIVVGFSKRLGLRGAAMQGQPAAVHFHKSMPPILHEKIDAREVVEERRHIVRHSVVAEKGREFGLVGATGHAALLQKHAAVIKARIAAMPHTRPMPAVRVLPFSALLLLAACAAVASEAPAKIGFNRDIRPILSENCFYCHGQDPKHREADLRLDSSEEAIRDLGGYAAIVPGKPEESELLTRLSSHDRGEVMPPPKANKHVTAEQIALLRRWIAEGAEYERHWAFVPPRRTGSGDIPVAGRPGAAVVAAGDRNVAPPSAIDAFVRARLAKEELAPAPPAAPEDVAATCEPRPHRAAADAAGDRRLSRRRGHARRGGLRRGGGSAAGFAALRRTPGDRLARRRALRGYARIQQ